MPSTPSPSDIRTGLLYALLAYGSWGFMTLYWKQVVWLPSLQLIAHRVLWTLLLLLPVLALSGHWRELLQVLRRPRVLLVLAMTAALISVNWLAFVWAVTHAQVVQASLGYFINPLLSVLLGVLVVRERLRPVQWLAVALAAAGVVSMAWRLGTVPWLALLLASTFALYGLLRKYTPVSATSGLAIESLLLAPFALAYLWWLAQAGQAQLLFSQGPIGVLWVALSGVITAMPLLWFANAARRLPLSTLGFMQYLAPSIQLAIGVFVFGEPFTRAHLLAFGMIWLALAMFSLDSLWAGHRARQRRRVATR